MGKLHKAFPNAKFIHIIRDGRDVALSRRKVGWTGTRSRDPLKKLLCAAKSWEMAIKEGQTAGKGLGNDYTEIRWICQVQDLVYPQILPIRSLYSLNALQKGQKGSVCCVCAKRTHNIHYATDLFAVEPSLRSKKDGIESRLMSAPKASATLADPREGLVPASATTGPHPGGWPP